MMIRVFKWKGQAVQYMSNNSSDIPNAIIGGILASLGMTSFMWVHNHRLNLSDILWAMTSFREKWLPEYFPLIAGIFLISGILFDCLQYDSVNNFEPYGPMQSILARTSMYGFAFSGFCMGLGAKLAGGDIIYHGFIGVARKSLRSVTVAIAVLLLSILWSWLLSSGHADFLADSNVNPVMEFMHIESANISIVLGCIFLALSFCWMRSRGLEVRAALKKVGGSLLGGVLVGLGFTLCGLSRRTLVFSSLTPGSDWSAVLLVFLVVTVGLNFLTYQVFLKKVLLTDEDVAENVLFFELKEERVSLKTLAGGVLIGTGWGVAGLDLTTYFIHSAIFSIPVVVIFGVFLILGTMIGDNFDDL